MEVEKAFSDRPVHPVWLYPLRASCALLLIEGHGTVAALAGTGQGTEGSGRRVGILLLRQPGLCFGRGVVLADAGGPRNGSRQHTALRRFDELGVDLILAEGLEDSGIGLAIMNRLRKAADRRIIADGRFPVEKQPATKQR